MVRIFLLIILFLSGEFISTLFAMNHANSSDSLTMSFEEPEGEASSTLTKRIKKRLKSAQNKYMEALHVFIFKVGQGNFCMIKKGENVIVVDAGSYSMQNSEVFNFEEIKDIFLLCLSNAKIKAVIITHADVDHYNFLKSLEQFFDPDCFFILGGIKKHKNEILKNLTSLYNVYWLDITELSMFIQEDKIGHFYFHDILSIENKLNNLIPNGAFQFLTPIPIEKDTKVKKCRGKEEFIFKNNDYSLVCKFTLGGNSILFTGDATGNTYNAYFPKTTEDIVTKQRNITLLKGVNIFMVPHHGSDTDNSPIWSDIIIKYNQTTLVGAIVSVGLNSPYSHPVSFIYDKPWPYTMRAEKLPVMAQWKQKKQNSKKISKNMHACIWETWNSFGVFDFVFTNNGDLLLLNQDNDKCFFWDFLIQENIPLNAYNAVKAFYDGSKKELNDIDRYALKFFPQYWREKILEDFNCMSECSDDQDEGNDIDNTFDNLQGSDISFDLFDQAKNNLDEIEMQSTRVDYHIKNVKGDGNCGFYAILQALNPEKDYSKVQPGDDAWNDAVTLRKQMFPNGPLSEMVTGDLNENERQQRYLPLDEQNVRRAIFNVAQEQNRQVIIVNTAYNSNDNRKDPLNYMFMSIDLNGDTTGYETFEEVLMEVEENPMILLYTSGHWQAVLPN